MRSFICSASLLDRDGRLEPVRADDLVPALDVVVTWQYTQPCFRPCLHSVGVVMSSDYRILQRRREGLPTSCRRPNIVSSPPARCGKTSAQMCMFVRRFRLSIASGTGLAKRTRCARGGCVPFE